MAWTAVLPAGGRPAHRWLHRGFLLAALAFILWRLIARVPSSTDAIASNWPALVLLILLAVVADTPLFTVTRRGRPAFVSGSVLFAFTIVLEWARGTGLWTQTLALLIGGLLARRDRWQIIWDIGRYGLALYAAGWVLRLGERPFTLDTDHPGEVLLVLAATVAWFIAFHVLTTTEAWLRTGERWASVSRRHLVPEAATAVPLLLLAPLLVAAIALNPWLVVLVLAPMYAVSRMNRLSFERSRRERADALTGLPNRSELHRRIDRAIGGPPPATGRAGPPGRPFAVLTADINGFRYVNEAFGYEAADRVLVEVSRRLARAVGADAAVEDGPTVARLGGDEFAIFAPGTAGTGAAVALGRGIDTAMLAPIVLHDLPLDVGVSVGVATYPEHGEDATTLLRHADNAVQRAKLSNEPVAVYRPGAESTSGQRLRLVGDLRHALREPGNSEIEVHYQPQVALGSGALVGVEALLRWRRPGRGLVDPEEVVRAAEHTGVMGLLTERVIDDVLAELARWSTHDLYLRASINVSVRDLFGPHLVTWLAERLRRYDISPGQVQFEITESALMADPTGVLPTLDRLHRSGIAVALDDFGTGYSSLQHLRRLPVTEVKIDRGFVQSMADNPDDDAVVRSIVGLSRELGMRVVAEGVEDERTARMLDAHGCHIGQGWLYGRAMPARDLLGWLAAYRTPHHVLLAGSSHGAPGRRPAGGGADSTRDGAGSARGADSTRDGAESAPDGNGARTRAQGAGVARRRA